MKQKWKQNRSRPSFHSLGLCLAIFVVALPTTLGVARAAAPSPRFAASANGAVAEAGVRAGWENYSRLKAGGVDQIYPQFALNLAKYARDGVAHRNILVVLAQFPSEGSAPALKANSKDSPAYYQRLFFSDDPNDDIISLREFYKINSNGRFIVSGQVTSEWIDMPHSNQYYSNGCAGLCFDSYPRSAQGLAADAMQAGYKNFENNLDYFDNDGPDGIPSSGDDDGYIDAVVVVHAGPGGEVSCPGGDPIGCDNLWSHEAGINAYSSCPSPSGGPGCLPGMYLGNVRGFLYLTVGEYNEYPGDKANGTYCHEFGHTLGLPDLYDPQAAGLGLFSLMALGNYLPYNPDTNTVVGPLGSHPGNLDAWCRQYLGFDAPVTPVTPGHYTLAPVTRGGGSLRIWTNGQPGSEYFLVENRVHEGPDQYLPGEGLLIYHIDDTKTDNLSSYPNYRVSCVQADSLYPLQLESPLPNYRNLGDPRDFFPGTLSKRSLTGTTSPNSRSFLGANTGIQIYNILGAADGADTASFDLALSTAPDIELNGYTLRDGNDGFADPNETDTLLVDLRNAGLGSGSLALSLTTSDPNVTVDTGASTAPALASDATATAASPFVFTVGAVATQPHVVTFTLAWSDGAHSGTVDFTVTVGAATGLSENFESGAEPGTYWSEGPIAPSTASQWHSSASRAHGGTRSAKVGSSNALGSGTNEAQTYTAFQDGAMITPSFGLVPGSELVFYSYIDAATNGGTGAWDGGRVEISLQGGPWTPLQVDDGYGYLIEFNSFASLRGAEAFSGSPQTWRRVTADLSAYTGEARLRFRFATDSGDDYPRYLSGAQIRYYEGWYVDDVSIQTRASTGPKPRVLSLRGGPNPYWAGGLSTGPLSFRFSAPDGLPHPGLYPTLRIFDVHGRLIRTLTASPSSLVPSEFQATWNAQNSSGQDCAAGIYIANVDIQGRSENFRVVVVR